MILSFTAGEYEFAADVKRVAFGGVGFDGNHYFWMQRSELSDDEILPDLGNIYIERDDQGWGGYGGIDRVFLQRDKLVVRVTPKMAVRMGGVECVDVVFAASDAEFKRLVDVLQRIFVGYDVLEMH